MVDARASVETGQTQTLVDLHFAVNARVTRETSARVAVYVGAAYALSANAGVCRAEVYESLTVGARVAESADTGRVHARLYTAAPVKTIAL